MIVGIIISAIILGSLAVILFIRSSCSMMEPNWEDDEAV